MDLRELDRRSLDVTSRFVDQVRDEHLDRRTPCAGWTLRDLLRHMVGGNNGFADAAQGRPADAAVWDGEGIGDDPRAEYAASATRVVTAFRSVEPLDGTFEVHGYGAVPAPTAVGMHLIDYLAHGWDVAVSIGAEPVLDEESCVAVLRIAEGWPRDSARIWGPGAPFAHRVEVPADASPQDRMLGLLGRSPSWSA